MIQLDLSDHRPLYEQIKEKLKALIVSGAVKSGERIPSVRELAGQLTINPNTIQRAYRELESEGYIYSIRAKGSFAAPPSLARICAEKETLREEFRSSVRQACFLGIDKTALTREIDDIYEEMMKDDSSD